MIRSRDKLMGVAVCVFCFSVACAAARTGFGESGPLLSRLDFFIMGFSVGVPMPGSFPNLLIWLGMHPAYTTYWHLSRLCYNIL